LLTERLWVNCVLIPDKKRFVLGLDGGGSKTIALVSDDKGLIVSAARAGGSEIYGGGETAVATILEAAETAIKSAGLSKDDIKAATFSLAGVDWPEDAEFIREHLKPLFPSHLLVRNDAIGALDGAIPNGPAIVVACGTGCGIASRNAMGQTWHSGFWQHPLGSHELGLKALQAICSAHQGIAETTSLEAIALNSLKLPTVEALLHAVTQRAAEGRISLTRLTPLLLDAAETGDGVSRRIVTDHADGLGRMAAVAARQVNITGQPIKVALIGGVFRHGSPLLPKGVVTSLRALEPNIETVASFSEPVIGSVIDSLRRIGVGITQSELTNLRQSMPEPTYFDTV
jgi:N-acetylglucosamine kinase-like BadF-type ATPase